MMNVNIKKPAVAIAIILVSSPVFGADKPEPLFTSGLGLRQGTVCVYKINHNGTRAEWKYEVAEVAGNNIKGSWTQVSPNPALSVRQEQIETENSVSVRTDLSMIHGTPMTLEPGIQWLAFPLQPKTNWDTESEVAGTDSKGASWKVKVSSSYEAKKWEKVKIAAGESMALRVDVKGRIKGLSANFSGSENQKMWVGHGSCPLKKLEYRNSFKERAELELASEGMP